MGALGHFGFMRNAWVLSDEPDLIKTQDFIRAVDAVDMGVADKGLVALIGQRGSGKSCALNAALGRYRAQTSKYRVAWVASPDKERLRIGHIMRAIFEDMGVSEVRRHDIEALTRQLVRVIGEFAGKFTDRRVIVVLDDAQRYRPVTIKALKNLRELLFAGKTLPMCVVLLGHPDLKDKLDRIPEVGYRTDMVLSQGLSPKERLTLVKNRVTWAGGQLERVFDAGALDSVQKFGPSTPLDVLGLCRRAMDRAYGAGRSTIKGHDVAAAAGGDLLWMRVAELNVTQTVIAEGAKVSKSTVTEVKKGGGSPKQQKNVIKAAEAAIERAEAGRGGGAGSVPKRAAGGG